MIYFGESNTDINCASCHGKDGKPIKKGARDLRNPKNTTRDTASPLRLSEQATIPRIYQDGLGATMTSTLSRPLV